MSGRLAVDFGTSNTILALWDEEQGEGVPIFIPEFGLNYYQGDEAVAVIPSLINYTDNNVRWIGNQVLERNLYHSRQTFRWMKRYIGQRSPIKIKINGDEVTPFLAGKDFLSTLIIFAIQQFHIQGQEIGFSVPVESFEHYENWLASVAEFAGMPAFRLID